MNVTKVTKSEIVQMIKEAVEKETGQSLNEEELQELLGGLGNLFKGAGQGIASGARNVANVAKGAAGAVGNLGAQVGQAVGNKVGAVTGAVKATYQAGEQKAAVDNVQKSLNLAMSSIIKATNLLGSDPNNKTQVNNLMGMRRGLTAMLAAIPALNAPTYASSTSPRVTGTTPANPNANTIPSGAPVMAESKKFKAKK